MELVEQYNKLYANTDYAEPGCTGNPTKWEPLKRGVMSFDNKKTIVDLGCGRGYYLRKLRSLGYEIHGVEQSSVCCSKYLTDIPHECSTIKDFCFNTDKRFDLVISTDVIEHIPENEVDEVIKGIKRISNCVLLGITNSSDKDPIDGSELHLCIHDRNWWTKKLLKFYDTVEYIDDSIKYKNEYFLLKCVKRENEKYTSKDYGIAISTYIGKETHPNRKEIFLTSVYSLVSSGFDGTIVIVDDNSINKEHLNKIRDIKNINIIERNQNIGISYCKNDGIKALDGCRYLFLADDDMIYNGKWWNVYIDASIKTEIEHFCYYVPQPHHNKASIDNYKGVDLVHYEELNGCLMFMTNSCIRDIGLFKDYNRKGWLEHPLYTQRCVDAGKMPFYCDVYGIREYLRLNRSSYECKSIVGH